MRLTSLLVLFPVLIADQAVKLLMLSYDPNLTTLNKSSWGYLLITLFILGFLLVLKKSLPIYLVISGGFSNLVDRIIRGGVVDYIVLPLFPWKFNLADLGITVGVIWFIYDTIIRHESGNNF